MKKIKGFALLILATALIIPLTIVNRWYVDAKYGDTNGYWKNTARNIDIFANVEFRALWNAKLRKENGYDFGKQGETISEALQRNFEIGKLTDWGMNLYVLIDWIDKGHFEKL